MSSAGPISFSLIFVRWIRISNKVDSYCCSVFLYSTGRFRYNDIENCTSFSLQLGERIYCVGFILFSFYFASHDDTQRQFSDLRAILSSDVYIYASSVKTRMQQQIMNESLTSVT